MIFGINETRDISKLSTILTAREITYNNFEISLWYLHPISLQIMVLPILIAHIQPSSLTRYLSVFFDKSGKCSSITKSTTFLKEHKKDYYKSVAFKK